MISGRGVWRGSSEEVAYGSKPRIVLSALEVPVNGIDIEIIGCLVLATILIRPEKSSIKLWIAVKRNGRRQRGRF